ncbi:MAG: SIP domain-containing protein [Tessaracoccus sp.]|uniref:siderophore-interacting protein n=1 Tax=Tessaracoccus sp. TaxID=1971211 RepID=UPI001EBC369D|nr:siderophore-interacting protein [Tessaracoccus sp.]MBK7820295.1 SIP domain-containing protein [Tessaracoccus sp.]
MAVSLRPLEVFPITTRTLQVLAVADVTPGMRRVTLGGPELAAHVASNGFPVAAFRSDGFDDEFKLLLTNPDLGIALGPAQADGVLDWARYDEMVVRTYTVRSWRPELGEVDVDLVLHGSGPATTWAREARVGDPIQIAGPKASSGHPEGADWVLIAGDETALPSIGRWLENWPEGARAQVFIEVAERSHRQDLPVPPGVEVTWLSRDGAAPGSTTLLLDALTAADWWEGTAFAWVAGEALTLTPIRRWLRRDKGLSKEQIDVTGYWRRQRTDDAADEETVDVEASAEDQERLHELGELLPPFALRVAATVGLPGVLDGRALSLADLAAELGTHPKATGKWVRYLAALGVVDGVAEDRVRLTPMGQELGDEHAEESLNLDGYAARKELDAALSLLSAVRTGVGTGGEWFGAAFERRVDEDPVLARDRADEAETLSTYVAGAVADAWPAATEGSVHVSGLAASGFAAALLAKHPGLAITVVGPPSQLALHRERLGDRVRFEAGSLLHRRPVPADAVLLPDVLETASDEDAVHILREAAASVNPGGAVVVFGELLDEALADEHEYEADVIRFALTGGGLRTAEEATALFREAGLTWERSTVGWGYALFALRP